MSEQILPSIRYINGHPYIRVRDLANAWYTTTSTILATGKPHQIPDKYRRMIDREAWVDVEGLRIRAESMKTGSNLSFQLKQLVDRFPKNETHVDGSLGPQVETIHMKEGSTTTITRCFIPRIDYPSQEEIQVALDNKQVLWRYKNKRIQVLAQTLSSFLDTRTSSLLAVNKKQGVPGKFIHRAWKRTWVDLEGLKVRVQHTEHGSALLKGLKQVIEILDAYKTAYTRPPMVSAEQQAKSASASAASGVANASTAPKPSASAASGVFDASSASAKPCDLAVEANKRAVHNTERLNKLDHQVQDVDARAEALEHDVPQLLNEISRHSDSVQRLKKRVDSIEAGDRKAVQAMREKRTPFDALSQRVSGILTHADRLDGKTDGLESRVSVLEDTSKWLSWSLATLLSLRFVGLMLRLLKRK